MQKFSIYILMFSVGCFILFLLLGNSPIRTHGQILDEDICLKVTMDSISYLGNEIYEMKTRLTNISGKSVQLAEYRQNFIIQNDGIGKWTILKHELSAGEKESAVLLTPGQDAKYSSTVAIPPSIPLLYRNNDGEINLRLEPKVLFIILPGQQLIENGEESSYWLKLGTSEWILREGM
jgi:hypothetical protein